MAPDIPRLLGLMGIFLILAGFRLLWQARAGFYYWLETYVRLFARLLREPEANHQVYSLKKPRSEQRNTLRLVVGTFLVFLLGPALIALSLTL